MQKLLKKTERAGPSAYHAAHKAANYSHRANNVKAEKVLTVLDVQAGPGEQLLLGTEGAKGCCSRAGIAI